MNNNDSFSSSSSSLDIAAADVLRLVQAHLTQAGLHQASAALRAESGVGLAAALHHSWQDWAQQGAWHFILQSLSTLDKNHHHHHHGYTTQEQQEHAQQEQPSVVDLWAAVHEMAILEVAAAGDLELAYTLLRLADADLQAVTVHERRTNQNMTRARRIELALEDLAQQQQQEQSSTRTNFKLPDDYYGPPGTTRDERRLEIGKRLAETLPVQPPDRLVTLLQQAVKYQSFVGTLPQLQQVWQSSADDDDDDDDNEKANRQESKKPKKKKRKVFDLVLGTAQSTAGASSLSSSATDRRRRHARENTSWNKALATVKFGKHAVCEAAVFTPNGASLITGSSDGMIEVWKTADYTLATDLPYQRQQQEQDNDDQTAGLGHATAVTALAVTNDGTLLASGSIEGEITVWRLDTGKALRQFTFGSPITCLAFTPDGSRLLACSAVHCREFGLRTGKCLREYGSSGDVALQACGFYVFENTGSNGNQLRVWTAAADGYLRWYQASTASLVGAWRPTKGTTLGSSIVADATTGGLSANPALVAVLIVTNNGTTSSCSFLLVPRGPQAFLVNEDGVVLRVYGEKQSATKAQGTAICTAALSPGQEWLYAIRENGSCSVFHVKTGELEQTVDHVAKDTAAKTRDGAVVEISSIIPHPFKAHVACFSNDKRQKKGQLVIWK